MSNKQLAWFSVVCGACAVIVLAVVFHAQNVESTASLDFIQGTQIPSALKNSYTFSEAQTFSGDVTLGDAITDTITATGTIKGAKYNITTKASGTTSTAGLTDDALFINTGVAYTLNLPTAASAKGKVYYIYNQHASATTTIEPDGSESIDTAANNADLDKAGEAKIITSNGTGWWTLGNVAK